MKLPLCLYVYLPSWRLCLPAILVALAALPVYSQSAVWQPQGAATGSIYYNGGNVGIGIGGPGKRLEIDKGSTIGDGMQIRGVTDTRITIGVGQSTYWSWATGWYAPGDFSLIEEGVAGGRIHVKPGGNVGIGTVTPQYKLTVEGSIGARDLLVTNAPWSDYVFRPDYRLRPLTEVEGFIREHGHLPEIPAEAEVKAKGVSVAEMQAKLLAKVEELTLHLIQQEKDNQELRERVTRLESPAASGTQAAGR